MKPKKLIREEQIKVIDELINKCAVAKTPHENHYMFGVLRGIKDTLSKDIGKVIGLDNLLPDINGKVVLKYVVDNGYSAEALNTIAVDKYLIDQLRSYENNIILTEEGLKEVSKVIGKIELDNYHRFELFKSSVLTLRLKLK